MRLQSQRSRGWQAGWLGSALARSGHLVQVGPSPGLFGGFAIETLSELVVIAAAATTDTTMQIPAGATVLKVETRVTVSIPTAVTYDIGVVAATTRYGTGFSTTASPTTNVGSAAGMLSYAVATVLRFTPDATPAAATGRVLTTIFFYRAS